MRWMALIVASILPGVAMPDDEQLIRLYHMRPSVPNNSSLTGECRRAAKDELVCNFIWTWLRYRVEPKDLEAETARVLAGVREEIKTLGLKKYVEKLCFSGDELAAVKKAIADKRREGGLNTVQYLAELVDLCDDPTQPRFEAFYRKGVLDDSRTCLINPQHLGPLIFRSAGPGKWTAKDVPGHLCGEKYLYTLELPPDNLSDWAWSRTVTHVDSATACKEVEVGETWRHSRRGFSPEISCEKLEFEFY